MWCSRDDPARGGYFDYGTIIYNEDSFFVESDADFYDNMGINFSWNEIEVVGNRHENSDLIKD